MLLFLFALGIFDGTNGDDSTPVIAADISPTRRSLFRARARRGGTGQT